MRHDAATVRALLDYVPARDDRAWMDAANCLGVDPELFFPTAGMNPVDAKEVCRSCSVRAECLGYALANGEKAGVWGGLTVRERRKLRRPARTLQVAS